MPSLQIFFGLPRFLRFAGIHSITIWGSLSVSILCICRYIIDCFLSISIVKHLSIPNRCFVSQFLILALRDTPSTLQYMFFSTDLIFCLLFFEIRQSAALSKVKASQ